MDRKTTIAALERLAKEGWQNWFDDSEVSLIAQSAIAELEYNNPLEPFWKDCKPVCSRCGAELVDKPNFCRDCGLEVKWNED